MRHLVRKISNNWFFCNHYKKSFWAKVKAYLGQTDWLKQGIARMSLSSVGQHRVRLGWQRSNVHKYKCQAMFVTRLLSIICNDRSFLIELVYINTFTDFSEILRQCISTFFLSTHIYWQSFVNRSAKLLLCCKTKNLGHEKETKC